MALGWPMVTCWVAICVPSSETETVASGAGIVHAVVEDGEFQGLILADQPERRGVEQAELAICFLSPRGEECGEGRIARQSGSV